MSYSIAVQNPRGDGGRIPEYISDHLNQDREQGLESILDFLPRSAPDLTLMGTDNNQVPQYLESNRKLEDLIRADPSSSFRVSTGMVSNQGRCFESMGIRSPRVYFSGAVRIAPLCPLTDGGWVANFADCVARNLEFGLGVDRVALMRRENEFFAVGFGGRFRVMSETSIRETLWKAVTESYDGPLPLDLVSIEIVEEFPLAGEILFDGDITKPQNSIGGPSNV